MIWCRDGHHLLGAHMAASLRNHEQLHGGGLLGVAERRAAVGSLIPDFPPCGLGQLAVLPGALARVVTAGQQAVADCSGRIHTARTPPLAGSYTTKG